MSVVTRDLLKSWLDRLTEAYKLIGPKTVGGVLLYRDVQNSAEIVWDDVRPVMSVKDAFFPATERILDIHKGNHEVIVEEIVPDEAQILFGVRPCDARGLLALDALFIESEPADINYEARRENTTIIGMACTKMADSCFCTSTGGAPDDPTGMDVMIYPVPEGYQIQVLTEKGAALVNDELPTGEIDRGTSDVFWADAQRFDLPDIATLPPRFKDHFWADMAERCLSCRICAYVCPTCRCFDVRDEPTYLGEAGNGDRHFERIRCWDSCASTAYRQIAGGHNPREAKGERLRNRFMCKFYYYPEQYGPTACTGCGRCIDACPVNIDITEVISYLQKATTTAELEGVLS